MSALALSVYHARAKAGPTAPGEKDVGRSSRRIVPWAALAGLATLLVLAPWFGAAAHDIPSDVTVQLFVKPAGPSLELLVRVPMSAMRDIDFPRRGPG